MASKVTNEDILRINELYYKHKTYAEVARQTGFSASTVKKYVIPGWVPVVPAEFIRFDMAQLPDFTTVTDLFKDIDNYGCLCTFTNIEQEQIKELWKELAI